MPQQIRFIFSLLHPSSFLSRHQCFVRFTFSPSWSYRRPHSQPHLHCLQPNSLADGFFFILGFLNHNNRFKIQRFCRLTTSSYNRRTVRILIISFHYTELYKRLEIWTRIGVLYLSDTFRNVRTNIVRLKVKIKKLFAVGNHHKSRILFIFVNKSTISIDSNKKSWITSCKLSRSINRLIGSPCMFLFFFTTLEYSISNRNYFLPP